MNRSCRVVVVFLFASIVLAHSYCLAASEGFADVPSDHWAYNYIEEIQEQGITTGCGNDCYCPDELATRAQVAVLIERAVNGVSYAPPAATGIFADVPTSHWAADWIEQAYADGLTKGCSTDPLQFCPDQYVTRADLAVFLLRQKHGSSYTPPTATGIFADVPTSYWAADWIEELYAEGITTGCDNASLSYCPDELVSRAELAAFLVRNLGLGDGGYLTIVNMTPHFFRQQSIHSYQMNTWSFPQTIPPGTTRVYIEWNKGFTKCWCDDAADAYYQIDGTDYVFDIYATGQCGSCGEPNWDLQMREKVSPYNVYDIGWRWNGWDIKGGVTLVIMGSYDPPYHIMTYTVGGSDWMGAIEDSRLLSTLTIPGTHDSATYNYTGDFGDEVKCQDVDFSEQLAAGNRFFDMRCTSVNNELELYHSTYDLGISLLDVLDNQIKPFLEAHSGETVLMSIKEEDSPHGDSAPLDKLVNDYVMDNPSLWYVTDSIPSLGEVRGKIVLLRRYSTSDYPLGIDLNNWPDNQMFTLTNSAGITYSVQDRYATDGGDTGTWPGDKEADINDQFNAAKVDTPQTLCINFTSSYYYGAYDGLVYALNPKMYASYDINPWLFTNLEWGFANNTVPFRTRLGIVPLNYFQFISHTFSDIHNAIPLLLIAYNDFSTLQGSINQSLIPNQYILSKNGEYGLIYQYDGNLVLYHHLGQSDQKAIWASGEYSHTPGWAIMQPDGNLVTYDDSNNPYWASGTNNNPGSWLQLGDDGTLKIINNNGDVIWPKN